MKVAGVLQMRLYEKKQMLHLYNRMLARCLDKNSCSILIKSCLHDFIVHVKASDNLQSLKTLAQDFDRNA